ncbi:hypothetical protein ABB07_02140 [Streptomyces incarnatus]|uniref:Uncharacterized protein n=1 Tax=Streptomyces incarnatus TaxID=665007 RepID=A0ABM5TD70_9ACTN|nr:hypothetical protein ABB07_02140 [Streptomyces incarnatus]
MATGTGTGTGGRGVRCGHGGPAHRLPAARPASPPGPSDRRRRPGPTEAPDLRIGTPRCPRPPRPSGTRRGGARRRSKARIQLA